MKTQFNSSLVIRALAARQLFWALPKVGQAQFTYSPNVDGTLTITDVPGASGAVIISNI